MNGRRASYLAARREVRERLRSRAFLISTLVQVLAVAAIAIAVSVVGGTGPTEVKVGAIGPAGETITAQAQVPADRLDLDLLIENFATEQAARAAIEAGDIEIAVGTGPVLAGSGASEPAQAVLGQVAAEQKLRSGLDQAGLPPARTAELLDSSRVGFEQVRTSEDDGGQGIAFLSTILLYLALIFAGYAVASGVVEEKSTRVVELIIKAMKPRDLLAGKVIGIGLMGLVQLLLVVAAGLGTTLLLGGVDLPPATLDTALLALLYFVLGFALYGCAFAVAGSIVSRQEDSQSSTAPVMILLVGSYIIATSIASQPSSTLAVIGTLLPPVAPFAVPARAASGELPLEQLLLSVVLMIAASAMLIWLAGRVYERAVLRTGAPIRFRELLRLLRSP